jgi:hypothetical protein
MEPRCPSSRLLAFSSASRLSLQISWYRELHTPLVRLNGRRGAAALISVLVWLFTSVQGVLLPSTNAGESMPPILGSHLGLVQAKESSITFCGSAWTLHRFCAGLLYQTIELHDGFGALLHFHKRDRPAIRWRLSNAAQLVACDGYLRIQLVPVLTSDAFI